MVGKRHVVDTACTVHAKQSRNMSRLRRVLTLIKVCCGQNRPPPYDHFMAINRRKASALAIGMTFHSRHLHARIATSYPNFRLCQSKCTVLAEWER
jgi:hypothetical protein